MRIVLGVLLVLMYPDHGMGGLRGPSCYVNAVIVSLPQEDTCYGMQFEIVAVRGAKGKATCDYIAKGDRFEMGGGTNQCIRKIGARFTAGTEPASTMGPNGVMRFIHWSNVRYDEAKDSPAFKGGAIHYQSLPAPLGKGTP